MSKESYVNTYSGLNVLSYKGPDVHPLMGLLSQEFPNWSAKKINSYMNLVFSKQDDTGGVLVARNEAFYYVGILIYTFQKIDSNIFKNSEESRKSVPLKDIIVVENLIASSPILQKEVFMTLINSSIKIGNLHSCAYIELPNYENDNLKLLELKYSGKIKKEGFRTYIELKDSK